MKKKKSWRTTLAGIAAIAFTGVGIALNPAQLLIPAEQAKTIATIVAGAGLIAGRDQKTHEEENKNK